MAKYKATVSFSGTITMCRDEIKDFDDEKQKVIIEDLLEAGYIVPVDKSVSGQKNKGNQESAPPPSSVDEEAPSSQVDSATDEEAVEAESKYSEDKQAEQAKTEEQPELDVVKNETKRSKKK